ncbi:MAG: hypothetical protein AAGB04_02245 [Pseudomonadota bacterium]
MELQPGKTTATPILRRGTRELAIKYDPHTGRLDISGRGFGESRTLSDIADKFCQTALAGAACKRVERIEWSLNAFLRDRPPSRSLPEGFSDARVVELHLRTSQQTGAKLIIRGRDNSDVYAYMYGLKILTKNLSNTYVRSVELALTPIPLANEEHDRTVFLRLTWPNVRSFDGASPNERRAIDRWLEGQFLRDLEREAA